ncbi:MAG: phosphotransferase, partial [Anaerolineales bacterium]|nr:phosphotransferase [Anaerolineales bacterium]
MTPVDAAVYAQVATAVFPHARLRHARPLAGGISAQMVALDVALPDGRSRRLVVRQASTAAAEYRLLRQLQPLPVAAPVPLALDLSGALLPTPYLVLDYVAG